MTASPIVGTAYTSQSKNLSSQRCVNLYLETVETKEGKVPAALLGCPGLTLQTVVAGGPIRGVHRVEANLYVVAGPNVWQLTTSFSAIKIGALGTTSGPVTIIDNGAAAPGSAGGGQVAFSDNVNLWCWNGGVWALVAWPGVNPPGRLIYQDTLGVCNELNTFNLWQSNIRDLTTWSPLNFSTADGSSDNIVTLADMHRQIVVLKERHCEFWINAGLQGFVFQRLDGVYPDVGCAAPASVRNCGEQGIAWLGQDDDGKASVYLMNGYEPKRISTYAIESEITTYATIADAIGWSYMAQGHRFFGLTFPSAGKTWVADLSIMIGGRPAWHERASFANGKFGAYEPLYMTLFAGLVIAGSGVIGNLYALDPNNFTDNGAPRKWLRSWRAKTRAVVSSVRYNVLEVDMETGTAPPTGNPQVVLRFTDDAHTWSHEFWAPAGTSGQYANRIRFRRLGMEARGLGNDRVFELSSSDPFKVSILGADVS